MINQIVVASLNPIKLKAIRQGFESLMPDSQFDFIAAESKSMVRDHPISADEALLGARNRIDNVLGSYPSADYYAAIEGGLLRLADLAWEIGWVVVRNGKGDEAIGLSSGVALKGDLLKGVIEGIELNNLLESKFGEHNAGKRTGFSGLVTNNELTREASYLQGVQFAVAQFIHPEYFS